MPWPAWAVQLVYAVVFFVAGEFLRPKPDFEDAEPIPFQEARIPQADPQRKQAIVWGRVPITSPHVMDVTEYRTFAISKKIKTGLFSSKRVVLGHRYFVGMQLGVCKGPVELRKVLYDDKVYIDLETLPENVGSPDPLNNFWIDEGDDGIFITRSEPNFLGGQENGGGINGNFTFYKGTTTQNNSNYLLQHQFVSVAYRWTSYFVLQGVEVGETPNIDSFSFEVERYPNPLGLANDGRVDGDSADSELNPMSIIVECFTDDDFGFNLPTTELDTQTFIDAANVLRTENNGMSLKWTGNQSIERIIENVNKQVDGTLRFNPSSGLWEYKLIRDDFVIGDLVTFDESNIKEVTKFTRINWEDTINEVVVNYNQRDIIENPSPATAQDSSNFRRQGRHRVLSLQFPGLYSAEGARNIASRELRGNAFTIANAQMIVNRDAWDLLPGDPFLFSWEALDIVQIVMRIGAMGFGDVEQTEIEINAIEDVFKLADNVFTAPPSTMFTSPNQPIANVAIQDVVDSPYLFNLNDADATDPGNTHKPLYLAAAPNNNSLNYRLSARVAPSSFVAEQFGDFMATGVLNSAIAEGEGGNTDVIGSIQVNSVSSPELVAQGVVSNADIKDNFLNLALIVSSMTNPHTGQLFEPEIVAFESALTVGNTVTINNIHRGLMDTLPIPCSIGDRIWFLSGTETEGPGTTVTEFGDADVVGVASTNVTPEGETDLGPEISVTMRNRVLRPYSARNFTINGDRYPTTAIPLAGDVNLRWNRNRRIENSLVYQGDGNHVDFEAFFELVLRFYDNSTDTLVWTVRAAGGDEVFNFGGNDIGHDWTNASQIAAGGPFAEVRAELTVVDEATGLIEPIAIINRIFDVTI